MYIGIDWGGTKLEAIALSESGQELTRRRVPTPREDYAGGIAAVVELVTWIEGRTGNAGTVGVGIPGTISPRTGRVKNANSTWLIGEPLDRDLARALGRDVRIANDANCLAVSEAVDGAGSDSRVVFGVIIGTGVGAGIAIDGHALEGRHRIAGEWGHNPLPWPRSTELPGPRCYCGKQGCIETFVSGPGFVRDYAEATGQARTAEEIVAAMRSGDPAASASYRRLAERMARGLVSVINVLDPDVIVLGGGLSNIDELYDDLPALLPGLAFSDACETPIRKARHGDSSGVRGAAWLWRE